LFSGFGIQNATLSSLRTGVQFGWIAGFWTDPPVGISTHR
jgi:hypothetical protein